MFVCFEWLETPSRPWSPFRVPHALFWKLLLVLPFLASGRRGRQSAPWCSPYIQLQWSGTCPHLVQITAGDFSRTFTCLHQEYAHLERSSTLSRVNLVTPVSEPNPRVCDTPRELAVGCLVQRCRLNVHLGNCYIRSPDQVREPMNRRHCQVQNISEMA